MASAINAKDIINIVCRHPTNVTNNAVGASPTEAPAIPIDCVNPDRKPILFCGNTPSLFVKKYVRPEVYPDIGPEFYYPGRFIDA